MAYLLRSLIFLMMVFVTLTTLSAKGLINLPYGHIQLAIPTFLFTIFVQAFVMFYFIGISRLTRNVWDVLNSKTNLNELFDNPPEDLTPYLKKTEKFVQDSTTAKRQTIPWTMLILILGMLGFFLGGAHDTGMVSKHVHSGVIYGFGAALIIGFSRQWYYLKKGHILLRKLKALFQLPDAAM